MLAFCATVALVSIPALAHDSLHEIYERTVVYQSNRGSPFSVWGLYGGLGGWQTVVEIGAVLLALALAVIPRRPGLPALAAAAAAILIALQLGIEHWFYLYIPWFFPLVMIALFEVPPARLCPPSGRPRRPRARGARRYAVGGAGGFGISTCSIESARNGSEQRITTPFSQGSSSEV